MILIANPLYDSVFKYLLEDKESARLLLSTLLEEEIVDLTLRPQEQLFEVADRSLTVYRLDFSARIQTGPDTYKLVILEIQKAKHAKDIMRFRRYLGRQYLDKENRYLNHLGQERALPIVSIYFLAFGLETISTPVLKVKRSYTDPRTQQVLPAQEPFIEALTHDAYIIQVGKLQEPYQTEAERLLRIFDQHTMVSGGRLLKLNEDEYPGRYTRLKERLIRAASEQAVRDQMDAEEDILEALGELEREVGANREALEESRKELQEKDQALQQKDQALQQKDQLVLEQHLALQQKDQALQQKDQLVLEQNQALQQKDQALQQKDQLVLTQSLQLAEKDRALADRDRALAEKERALAEKERALADRDRALAQLSTRLDEQGTAFSELSGIVAKLQLAILKPPQDG